MFKPQITAAFLLLAMTTTLFSEIGFAQGKSTANKKAWKRPVTYIMPTPRVKAKKYVYQIETRHVTRATAGRLLPSQIAINTRSASSDGSAVSLREKPKFQRSIASEGN